MNYAYNVKMNLRNKLYNFYEWDNNIEFYDKLKVYKVDDKIYNEILKMSIKVNSNFLNNISLNKFTCIFTNDIDMVGVRFGSNGEIELISKLDLEEESELLEEININNKYELEYEIINKNNQYSFNTMEEDKTINYLIKYIENNKKNSELIDYLYNEWFNDNKSKNKYERLINAIKGEYTSNHNKLYNVVKMLV